MAESKYIWPALWIPKNCAIVNYQNVYDDIQEALRHYPEGYRRQFERRLTYIGQLTKPISDKNYMYQIEAHYYECYIFGKNNDVRLLFDWSRDPETSTVLITVMGLANHNGVKRRKFKESEETAGDQLAEEDVLFLERFL